MRQLTRLQVLTASAIWHKAVKSFKRLLGLLVRSAPLVVGRNSVSWVKACFLFARYVRYTLVHQGHRGLAIQLKTANVMLMKSLAGTALDHPRLIGAALARTRTGIPRLIPAGMRKRIRDGDKSVIRLYLGFFTLYRVLDYRGKLKLSTLTNPGVELTPDFMEGWRKFCQDFLCLVRKFNVKPVRTDLVPVPTDSRRAFVNTKFYANPMGIGGSVGLVETGGNEVMRGCRQEIWGYVPEFILLNKSGPNSKGGRTNIGNIILDYFAWLGRPALLGSLQTLMAITRMWDLFPPEMAQPILSLKKKFPILVSFDHKGLPLGALRVKVEPGKMRVFAMVDSLTQWMLYPLHKWLFSKVLQRIPQDGTFDQLAPVKRLIALVRGGRDHRLWSFDLSAATDRIPVALQEVLLGQFMTPEFAEHWRKILCDREYKAPPEFVKEQGWDRTKNPEGAGVFLKYRVGQPMGAYSSWAMLALVHHAMVQYAARKAGSRGWFAKYAVLGDDLVIGDHLVAHEYLQLCKVIGVEINLSKSIISDNLSLEFAKRYFYKGEDVSPLPLLAIALGWLGVRDIAEIVLQVKSRTGNTLSFYAVGKFMGLGFKTISRMGNNLILSLSRKARSTVLLLTRPGAVHGVENLLDWYTLTRGNGSKLQISGAWDRVVDAFRHRVDHFQKLNLRARLYKACASYSIIRYYKKYYSTNDITWFGIPQWWEETVIRPFKAPILQRLDEVDQRLSRIDQVIEEQDPKSLLDIVQAMEDLEREVCLLPSELKLERAEKEIVRGDSRFPKTVRAWNKLSKKFRRAYQDSAH